MDDQIKLKFYDWVLGMMATVLAFAITFIAVRGVVYVWMHGW